MMTYDQKNESIIIAVKKMSFYNKKKQKMEKYYIY